MIRLKAIAINPADIKMIDQGHRVTSWPLVPGLDGAGVVEAVGEHVKRFKVGDEVLASFGGGGRGASYQEVAVVKEGIGARKPEAWGWEEAASLPCVLAFLSFPFPATPLSHFLLLKRGKGMICLMVLRGCLGHWAFLRFLRFSWWSLSR